MNSRNSRPRILVTLTAHGFGHMTRTLAVVRELVELSPQLEVVIATSFSRSRLERELRAPFVYHRRRYEPGTAQKNCFEVDPAATRAAYRDFVRHRSRLIEDERTFFEETRIGGVLSDIAAFPVRVAGDAGLPAVGLSNFTWDWILEPLLAGSAAAHVTRELREDYSRGHLQLRLPFGPRESPFPRSEAVPLVGRRAALSPEAVRSRLGIPEDGLALALVCPGGWGAEGWSAIHVPGCAGFRFVFVGDLPITADASALYLPQELPEGLTVVDLIGAAEVVITKPGYGVASECILARTPLVSIERRGFRESGVLVKGLRDMGPCEEMSLAAFFAGEWEEPLSKVRASETPWAPVAPNGTRETALRVAESFSLETVSPEAETGPPGTCARFPGTKEEPSKARRR